MLKFLIGDDHEIVRRGIKQILREGFSNAHFDEAADAATLVEKAVSNNWDIIVSDMSMPCGGGFRALEQITEYAPGIPVLILSIYSHEQYASRMIEAGAAGYLTKDAAPEQIVNAVQMILSGRRFITANNLI